MSYRLAQWAGLFVLAIFAGNASATVIQDATGEQFNPTETHLDFSSVEVTNDASNIRFKLSFVGNPTAPTWGKYMIGIDSADGGTSTSNGWGRPITLPGMDYWIGSWVDTTPPGQEVYHFVNNTWARTGTTYGQGVPLAPPVVDGNSVTLTLPLSQLGLTEGGTINFDVFSSGGGGADSAIDASSNPGRAAADWGVAYSSGDNVSTFTVVVPEPAALGLLSIGALVLMRRR